MNNKGSTLIMVLLFMMILSILSLSILYLSVSNNKMQHVDVAMKKEFYAAEAGIEEAYAKIEILIKDAIDLSQDQVRQYVMEGVDKDDYTRYTYDLFGAVIGEEINEEQLAVKMTTWFTLAYKTYLTNHIEDILETISTYEVNRMFPNKISIGADTIDAFGVSDEYVIQITSTYIPDDGGQKTVTRSFAIGIPDYNQPYYSEEKYYDLSNLQAESFIDNALTAEKNIKVMDGSVTVFDGNIYALGGDNTISEEPEGIIVEDGELILEQGKLITRKYVKALGNQASVMIYGDVYCNTLAVGSDARSASITIGKDTDYSYDKYRVLTEDDIELNGSQSDIKIYGSYYGFSVGITNTLNNTHDQSSAVVINSPDIGIHSSMLITGEATDHDSSMDPVGVLIGGTAYIDFNESQRYQTGESVSIGGNYLAYTPVIVPLIMDSLQQTLGIPITIDESSNYGTYNYTTEDDTVIETQMADTYNEGLPLTAKIKGDILTRAKANNAFDVMIGWNALEETGVKMLNVKYATGAYITEGEVLNNKKAYLAYQEQLTTLREEYQSITRPVHVEEAYTHIDKTLKAYHASSREFLYMSKDATKDVTIVGQDASVPASTTNTYYVGDRIKGIIISAGDVYIYGELYYEGIIATSGNIYFMDDGDKTIRLDKTVRIKSNYTHVGIEDGLNNPRDYTTLVRPFGWSYD